jgi:hypothetical protein
MRALAAELGIVPVRLSPSACAPHVRRAMVLDAMPYTWATGGFDLGLVEAAKAGGADVVLTGVGGDSVFDGDPACFAEAAARGHLLRAFRAAIRLKEPWYSTPASRIYHYVLRPLVRDATPSVFRSAWRVRRARRALPAWAGPRLRSLPFANSAYVPHGGPSGRFASLSFGPGILSMSEMRGQIEAATSLRCAAPLLDPTISELLSSLHPEILLHGDRVRGLLRLAAAGKIPDCVRLRNDKAAFECAVTEMVGAAGGLDALGDITKVRALADLGIVEPQSFQRALARFRAGEDDGWLDVWPALACESFLVDQKAGRRNSLGEKEC